MPRYYCYDIDWFEDGVQLVECGSDEGEPLEAMDDRAVGDVPSWSALDPSEVYDRESRRFLSQPQRDNATSGQSTPRGSGDILPDIMIDGSVNNAWHPHFLEAGYGESVQAPYGPESYWDRLSGRDQLVSTATYSWWWFATLIDRVESGEYYSPFYYADDGYDSYDSYDWRYDLDWRDGDNFNDDDGYLEQDLFAPDNVIDEKLPNLANFPPTRDYFIYPRHPTEQWWPLS
ncbi:uncharacterized protein F4812DRAFT_458673 [Daldinia caldariorum]|uniref:uncharacterized protein n=1 Tax=Daldinia caldariorum TaxID=326644 RepID=UPI002008DB4F|nr:uncharacterized protein F4812DRAFT_458673 [Daldinia caldariorum]KAI1468241.1 hypothetical protein F4812DRAFT_458673 [Daldinia caldariorum]